MSNPNVWVIYCEVKAIVEELRPDLAERFDLTWNSRGADFAKLLTATMPRPGGWEFVDVMSLPRLVREILAPVA